MSSLRRFTRPLPYLDDAPLQRLWAENELSIGRIIALDRRRYRVLGFDPVSVRPRRLYVEDVGSGRQHTFVIDEQE